MKCKDIRPFREDVKEMCAKLRDKYNMNYCETKLRMIRILTGR